jgi:hypothetical protein
MTGMPSHEAKLRLLLFKGSVARSTCGASFLALLRPLLKADVLTDERAAGGRRIMVRDPGTLNEFLRSRFPNAPIEENGMSRIIGVARFRDSKAIVSNTPEILVTRAWRDTALDRDGSLLDVVNATAQHGVFSFLLEPGRNYQLHGPCALVENPALFTCFERLGLDIGLVIHGRGRASQQLINWLSNQAAPDFALLHLPDYDPFGMDEFRRLRRHLKTRVRLYIPADLESLFAKFATRSLLGKKHSRAVLARLRDCRLPEVQQIVAMIDRYNAGLEQEALLL